MIRLERVTDEYDIYVRGFAAGAEAPERALQRVFGLDPERAREFVLSLPRVVKRRLTAEQVVRYELALRHARADYELRKSPLRPAPTEVVVGVPPQAAGHASAQAHGSTISLPPPTQRASRTAAVTHTGERGTDDLPPPWEVPGLDLGSRPDWVVDAPNTYRHDEHREPATATASRRTGAHGSGSVPDADHVYRVGTVGGADAPSARARVMRAALWIAVAASLATIAVVVVQHYGLGERDALAQLGARAGVLDAIPAHGDDPLMPIALDWAQSDLHQFSNGDKARVRALIERFDRAGAREVHAAHITPSGQLSIAAELVVVLPRGPSERKAVFSEYERFLRSAFGDFVAPPEDDGTELLRIAL